VTGSGEPPPLQRNATIDAIRDRRRTFVADADEARFRGAGYLVRPLLSADQVRRALDLHTSLVGPGDAGPIRFDSVRSDRGVIEGMTRGLAALWDEVLPGVLDRHRIVFSSCVVKDPSTASGMEAHDDRSFVDERTARSLTLWIPLVDTSPEAGNGHLALAPHSEHLAAGFGGTNIATWYAPYRAELAAAMVPVAAAAGTAVIYDSRSVHGSPPNRSTEPRAALVVVAAPQEADLVHAVATSRRGRRLLAVDPTFHVDHSPLDLRRRVPDLEELDRFTDPPVEADPRQVQALVGGSSAPVPVAERPSHDRTGRAPAPSPRTRRIDEVPADLVEAVERCTEALLDAVVERSADAAGQVAARVALVEAGSPVTGADPALAAATAPLAPFTAQGAIHDVALRVLAPGADLGVEDPQRRTVLLPLAAPALAAGAATADDVAPFELGLAVALADGRPNQVFNDGIDPLPLLEVVLVEDVGERRAPRRKVRWWRR